jgi:hypothetical protein
VCSDTVGAARHPQEIGFSRQTTREFDRSFSSRSALAYTHWDQDSHQDHTAVARTVIAAARKNRCSLLMYEQTIPGGVVPGGFKAQSFVDISDFIDRKTQSILIHRTQIAMNGGDWWLEGLRGRAMYRGYQINVRFAEAFEVVKEVDVHFSNKPARWPSPATGERAPRKTATSYGRRSIRNRTRLDVFQALVRKRSRGDLTMPAIGIEGRRMKDAG